MSQRGTKSQLVVAFMVDAMRVDYLDRSPGFLRELAEKGQCGKLVPSFGFEPDASFLAGLLPEQADGGAQFWHEPRGGSFSFTRWLPPILDRLPPFPHKIVRYGIRRLARLRTNSPYVHPVEIPLGLLRYFDVPLKKYQDEPGFLPVPSIFDHLRGAGRKWLLHAAPTCRVEIGAAVEHARQRLHPPIEFAYFHVCNLDVSGHRFGPSSIEVTREIQKIDAGIKEIFNLVKGRYDEVHWIVFGDHGMLQVDATFDLLGLLHPLGLRVPRDYLLFVDSTMARFWYFNPKARERIREALAQCPAGSWLTQADRDKYALNYSHTRFGEDMFLANPGTLLFPNYYQVRHPVKGMHGYLPEHPDQQSLCIVQSPRVKGRGRWEPPRDMRALFTTFLGLLDISTQRRDLLAPLVEIGR